MSTKIHRRTASSAPSPILNNNSDVHYKYWEKFLTMTTAQILEASKEEEFISRVWAGIPNDLRPQIWMKALNQVPIMASTFKLPTETEDEIEAETENCVLCDAFNFEELKDHKRAEVKHILTTEAQMNNRTSVREGSAGLVARITEVTKSHSDAWIVYSTITSRTALYWDEPLLSPSSSDDLANKQKTKVLASHSRTNSGIVDFVQDMSNAEPDHAKYSGSGLACATLLIADAIAHFDPLLASQLQEVSYDVHDLNQLVRLYILPLLSTHFSAQVTYRVIDIVLFDLQRHSLLGIIVGILKIAIVKFQNNPLPPLPTSSSSSASSSSVAFFTPIAAGSEVQKQATASKKKEKSSLKFAHTNANNYFSMTRTQVRSHFLSFLNSFCTKLESYELERIFADGFSHFRVYIEQICSWEASKSWKRALVVSTGPLQFKHNVGSIETTTHDPVYNPAPVDVNIEIRSLCDKLIEIRNAVYQQSRPKPPATPAPPGVRRASRIA